MRTLFVLAPLVAVIAIYSFLILLPRVDLPSHLLNRTIIYQEDFLDKETHAYLGDLVKKQSLFPTNAADTLFFESVEDIGEAIPIGSNGKCDHPFLVPNSKRTHCVIPGRIDVARNFIKSGGPLGFKEFYEKSISRLLSFGRYNFDLDADPIISNLFKSDKFKTMAESVCPHDRRYLDPFQYNFIIQLHGQTVATHLDAVYFDNSNRFSAPQYLGIVMKFSGLWEDSFVPQNQVVAYLHNWEDDRGGNFIYWNDNDGDFRRESPKPRAGSGVDGSSLVHAGDVYKPDLSHQLPMLDKSKFNRLVYKNDTSSDDNNNDNNEHWDLMSNDYIVKTYNHDDLRICIVYRARCFKDENAAKKFNLEVKDPSKWESIESILLKLGNDLIQRGRITQDQLDIYMNGSVNMPKHEARLEYGLLLVDEYVKYPLSPLSASLVPYNYCALAIKFTWLKNILAPFCT